jgi:hypothetical protein
VLKARDEPATYWIADLHEDDGDSVRFAEHRRCRGRAVGQDQVGPRIHDLSSDLGNRLRIRRRPTLFEPDVPPFRPPELQKFLAQRRKPQRSFRVVFGERHHDADSPHLVGLLRTRRERPSSRRAADENDEFASPHRLAP